MSNHFLNELINPESVAFYGANNKASGIGTLQLMGLIVYGYKGKIYPIHLSLDNVMGLKAYKSIKDVPEVPDLVVIVLPPKVVPQIFEECGQKGVKNIILISGGFREMTGDRENSLTYQISNIAKKYGMRFIGPNCLGIYNGWYDPEDENSIFNTAIWEKIQRGYFSIASQSGTLASHIWFDPRNLDLGLSRSISVGNEANVDIVDCLEFFKEDDKTRVIGLYIEEIKRGKRFLELAREITPKKPIIAIHVGGGTGAADRAIKSHTGSLGGDARIYEGVFKEAGIIKTELVEEYLDTALLLTRGIYPKGRRLGIITNSGGPGAMIANHAEKCGLVVPEFSKSLKEKLKSMLSKTASYRNPIDSTFDMNLYNYYVALPKTLMRSGEIDVIIMYGVFGFQDVLKSYISNEQISSHIDLEQIEKSFDQPLEQILIKPTIKTSKRYSVPIVYINPQNFSSSWSKKIRENGGVLFQFWDRPVRCVAKLCDYSEYRRKFEEM
ncbi:MAG: hypothetical protein GF353_04640 [Candidatus Lokiarchaeota archaeon]|nr:hypothetical protein [Candidatus Lokiarchaeota archaeon]